jgi:triacylglycerol lipase
MHHVTIPKLRSPIVLVHGVLGFDRIRLGGVTVASYFCQIPENLAAAGNRVLVARLSPTGSIAARAAQLQTFLNREVPGEPVHLFAHSMGGLDSRYLITKLGLASRVLSLTTIGTPHRGTAFADWALTRCARLAKLLTERMHVSLQAFYDLTTDRCRAFNEQVPDMPEVRYFSVGGRHEGSWRSLEWQLPHTIVKRAEGPNDGIVSLASATYGEDFQVWSGDHVSLINWWNPLHFFCGWRPERTPQYAALLGRLADEGF